jgi:hypothetical protein
MWTSPGQGTWDWTEANDRHAMEERERGSFISMDMSPYPAADCAIRGSGPSAQREMVILNTQRDELRTFS